MWFEIYEEQNAENDEPTGKWRWRLKNRNGRISADGGEPYSSKSGCRRAVNSLKHEMRFADVEIRYAD